VIKPSGPHMPLYVDRFLAGTMAFEAHEIGAYLLLITHQWQHGSIENDQRMIERVSRCEYGKLRRVLAKFVTDADGALVNPVCAKIRAERDAWLKLQAEKGKRGMAARWGDGQSDNQRYNGGYNAGYNAGYNGGYNGGNNQRNNHTDTDTDTIYRIPIPTPEGEEGGKSARPPAKGRKIGDASVNPPSFEDCVSLSAAVGMDQRQLEEFFAYYNSQGWKKGNGQPITSVGSAMQSWKIKGQRYALKEKVETGKVDQRKGNLT
jgi:uncharacterized protein YdaU (DUF1376 family)